MKTFYIAIKTIERVKKQTVSKKDGRFAQFTRLCPYMSIPCSAFFISVLVCL